MSVSKSHLLASALVVVGLGVVALGYAAPQLVNVRLPNAMQSARVQPVSNPPSPRAIAEAGARVSAPEVQADRDVRVDAAPHTAVRVNKETGKVAVRAPHTDVKVDPDKGRVRVRAPYVDLDIRW